MPLEVTLQQVLDAREARAFRQMRLMQTHQLPMVSFTMNIAGPVKRTALTDYAFLRGAEKLKDRLGEPRDGGITDIPTGLEGQWVYETTAEHLKEVCMQLEQEEPAGRLYDMDVLSPDGQKLDRPSARTCLVCGGPVGPCSRSRAHGLPAIVAATEERLRMFAITDLAELAVEALEQEVSLTPKPGLVDSANNGAHTDMDLEMFLESAQCLRDYFRRCVAIGMEDADCMARLQKAGLDAERTMFAVTGGVNTHKGAIYSFGLLLGAMGSCLIRGGNLFETAAALAQKGIPPRETHGTAVQEKYGAGGARAEALSGFPAAQLVWKALRDSGDPFAALLTAMAQVDDTNVLHRGGVEGLEWTKKQASAILAAPRENWIPMLEALDQKMILHHLSPGGCADLLAIALFLNRVPQVVTM